MFIIGLMTYMNIFAIYPYDFEVDGIYYVVYNLEKRTCCVVPGDNNYSGELVIPETVTYKDRQFTVVAIASFAFDNSKISNLGNGDSKTEDLEFKVAYRLESTRTINTSNYVLKFSFDSKTKTNYGALNSGEDKFIDTSCVTNDFEFTLPQENKTITNVADCVTTSITYDSDFMGATVNTTFKFSWGESFNFANPGLYYKDGADISVYKELATKLKRFGELSKNLTDVNITITPDYVEGVN